MRHILNIYFLVAAALLSACSTSSEHAFENGIWRATLKTQSGAEIPFNFEVIDSADRKVLYILNASERLKVSDITQREDSVLIQMPFESEIRASFKGKRLSGHWIKHLADSSAKMEFNANPDQAWRFFKAKASPEININGRWSALFTSEASSDSTIAIGEFSQTEGIISGTFMTSTGDYRFLEGTISDKNLYLSSFDGGSAYLFTGKLLNDSTIADGKFYSGLSGLSSWIARKDEKAVLPDAYSLTALKSGYKHIDFSFENLEGKKVALSDPKYKNKVVLVQFFGSWCPNCMDETAFLVPYYDRNKDRGLEVVALAYERTTDVDRARKNVQRLRDRLKVNYEILLTGYTNDKEAVAKSLPMLKNFVAFPTLIIIDKKGIVRKIHTGFSGPGTGSHYEDFVRDFEATMNELLAE